MSPSAKTSVVGLPWPDVSSESRPGETVRAVLDYIAWIAKEMRLLGFHGGSRREEWRRRVHQAYAALFVPAVPGYGDPYPPDVPPARSPGLWPDIPSAAIPGMTIRHQLSVLEQIATQLRDRDWFHMRKATTAVWDGRLSRARAALDHGDARPMPEEAHTRPSDAVLAAVEANRKALAEKAKRRKAQVRAERRASKRAQAKATRKKAAAPRAAATAAAPSKPAPAKTAAAQKAPAKKAAKAKAPARKKAAAKKATGPKKAATRKKTARKAAPKKAARQAATKPKKAAARSRKK